ncbi:hypothetical protein B0H16DRAFT_1474552 [Mycena metata]|uniref:Uncharacterized protein n=1 Tax=Mycena metata TaxID=1033252 RepID=A0AAD7MJH6_9AGAR|nr:hypothetical protein B0H16DRAFT_1474552 [Mycena metata]
MHPIPIDSLPDELLAAILKLVADFPISCSDRSLPTAVIAGRRPRSRHWAALCINRSRSYPLDTINLESYLGPPCAVREVPDPLPLRRVLALVGPHIGRWRTFALHAWPSQFDAFRGFVEQSPLTASRLQSAHFSAREQYDCNLPQLKELFVGERFCSFRSNAFVRPTDLAAFGALCRLDIEHNNIRGGDLVYSPAFRHLLGTSSTLTVLVIRNLYPEMSIGQHPPLVAPTIRSCAFTFTGYPYFIRDGTSFDYLSDTFSLPNLEYLEIVGAIYDTPKDHLPALFFPHLQTLRLENVSFGERGLAFVQSFSSTITNLEIIRNHSFDTYRVLARPGTNNVWPDLVSLTVEDQFTTAPAWISPFLTKRSQLGGHSAVPELILSPWEGGISIEFLDPAPAIHWQHSGPSAGLVDGAPGFYTNDYTGRPTDFGDQWAPRVPLYTCGCDDYLWWNFSEEDMDDLHVLLEEEQLENDLGVRLEDEIRERLKMQGEIVRMKAIPTGHEMAS